MKAKDIIHLIRSSVEEVMTENIGTSNLQWQSSTIAKVLFLYNNKIVTDDDIKNFNNLFHYIDPSTDKPVAYGTLKECLLVYIQNNEEDSEEFLAEKERICKSYNLYRFDREYLDSVDSNIVDIDGEKTAPCVDVYTVRDNNGKELARSSNLNDAQEIAKSNKGSAITNSRNEIVDAVIKPTKSENIVSLSLSAGAKVRCNGLNLYKAPTALRPFRCIDGEYYLYSGIPTNNRFPLCLKPEFAGDVKNVIIGWVNEKDLKK